MYKKLIISLFLCSLFASRVYAQIETYPTVTDQASKEKITPATLHTENEKINTDTSKINQTERPAVLKTQKFLVKNITITGNTIFKTEELNKLVADIIGKNVDLEELNQAAGKITKLYNDKGYITSKAYLPPQKVTNGQVQIVIMEGKIGNLKVGDAKWTRTTYIQKNLLAANGVKENSILNINNINNSMDELNSKDYLKGRIILERGKIPETTDAKVEINDRIPLDFNASWDNMGRDDVGLQRANLELGNNNFLGFGDELSAGVSLASRSTGVNTKYSIPLGSKGTELAAGYSFSHMALGGAYESLAIKGSSHDFYTTISHPLYNGNIFKVTSDLTWDMRHSLTTMQGSSVMNNSEVRALRTGINVQEDDSLGRTISRFEISDGIPILGATKENSYDTFVKLTPSITRIQKLPKSSFGILRVSGQYSPDPLLSVEQMQVGGMYTVRGYDEGILFGDVGYVLSMEARTPVPFLPEYISIPYWKHKSYKFPLKNKIYFATFYDQGWARELHKPSGNKNFLQSVGAGLRCYLTKFIAFNMDLGVPIGRKIYDEQQTVKFHFSLTSDVF